MAGTKKPLYIRLPKDLEKDFSKLCEQEGYQKNGLIVKWVRNFLEVHRPTLDLIQAQDYGVDLSLLKSNLTLSPTERLENHQQALSFCQDLGEATFK